MMIASEAEASSTSDSDICPTALDIMLTCICSVESFSKESDNVLYVPNSCLLKEDGKFYVFLKRGGNKGKTEVKAGPANSHHTLIFSGVEAGQALVPFETVLNKKSS